MISSIGRRELIKLLSGMVMPWPCAANAQRPAPPAAAPEAHPLFSPALIEDLHRDDGSLRLRIQLSGSLQNPAWSPDGRSVLFTRFRDGYNRGPADLFLCDVVNNRLISLVEDGASNISQPGSTWNARTARIVFSSTRDGRHDEIYSLTPNSSLPQVEQLTSRDLFKSYEPSFAPDGRAIVFESHARAQERGRITMRRLDPHGSYIDITEEAADCREPNWSPAGDLIAYQKLTKDRWEIWLCDLSRNVHRQLTKGEGDKTDATFSPDGRFVLYSGESDDDDDDDDNDIDGDNLFALSLAGGKPIPITRYSGYHGASSWSPGGGFVVLEAAAEAPTGKASTYLQLTPVPKALLPRR